MGNFYALPKPVEIELSWTVEFEMKTSEHVLNNKQIYFVSKFVETLLHVNHIFKTDDASVSQSVSIIVSLKSTCNRGQIRWRPRDRRLTRSLGVRTTLIVKILYIYFAYFYAHKVVQLNLNHKEINILTSNIQYVN